jgi:hypothetical protein
MPTIVYFPGADTKFLKSSRDLGPNMLMLDFVIRSGRAVLFPVYKGTYERKVVAGSDPSLLAYWAKDLGRSIDYLETREDIDTGRLAYYGLSMGASAGLVLTAVEKRCTPVPQGSH